MKVFVYGLLTVAITFVLDTYQMKTWLNMSEELSIIHAVVQPGELEPASISIFLFIRLSGQHVKSFYLPLHFQN